MGIGEPSTFGWKWKETFVSTDYRFYFELRILRLLDSFAILPTRRDSIDETKDEGWMITTRFSTDRQTRDKN